MQPENQGSVLSQHKLVPVTFRQKISQWWYGVTEPYLLRFGDFMLRNERRTATYVQMAKPAALPSGVIISTEAACRFVDFIYAAHGTRNTACMAVTACVCQTALNKHREPRLKDLALLYAAEMYTTWKYTGIKEQFTRIETAAEAKALLRSFHQAGLLHNVLYCHQAGKWTFVMCNCDDEICVPYRSYRAGRTQEFGAGPEIVAYDPAHCLGPDSCGHCLTRCVLQACAVENGTVTTDLEQCLGCGLCVSTCLGNARSLIPRLNYQHEDVLTTAILLGHPRPEAGHGEAAQP